MNARATTPPVTPPAIAPVFDDFLKELLGVMTEEEAVGAPMLAVAEAVTVLALAFALGGPTMRPSNISGRSEKDSWMRQLVDQMRRGKFDCVPPTVFAVVAFHFPLCRRREHLLSWVSGRC